MTAGLPGTEFLRRLWYNLQTGEPFESSAGDLAAPVVVAPPRTPVPAWLNTFALSTEDVARVGRDEVAAAYEDFKTRKELLGEALGDLFAFQALHGEGVAPLDVARRASAEHAQRGVRDNPFVERLSAGRDLRGMVGRAEDALRARVSARLQNDDDLWVFTARPAGAANIDPEVQLDAPGARFVSRAPPPVAEALDWLFRGTNAPDAVKDLFGTQRAPATCWLHPDGLSVNGLYEVLRSTGGLRARDKTEQELQTRRQGRLNAAERLLRLRAETFRPRLSVPSLVAHAGITDATFAHEVDALLAAFPALFQLDFGLSEDNRSLFETNPYLSVSNEGVRDLRPTFDPYEWGPRFERNGAARYGGAHDAARGVDGTMDAKDVSDGFYYAWAREALQRVEAARAPFRAGNREHPPTRPNSTGPVPTGEDEALSGESNGQRSSGAPTRNQEEEEEAPAFGPPVAGAPEFKKFRVFLRVDGTKEDAVQTYLRSEAFNAENVKADALSSDNIKITYNKYDSNDFFRALLCCEMSRAATRAGATDEVRFWLYEFRPEQHVLFPAEYFQVELGSVRWAAWGRYQTEVFAALDDANGTLRRAVVRALQQRQHDIGRLAATMCAARALRAFAAELPAREMDHARARPRERLATDPALSRLFADYVAAVREADQLRTDTTTSFDRRGRMKQAALRCEELVCQLRRALGDLDGYEFALPAWY